MPYIKKKDAKHCIHLQKAGELYINWIAFIKKGICLLEPLGSLFDKSGVKIE